MRDITLWDHQADMVEYLVSPAVRRDRWGVAVLPTGAGKTNALVVAALSVRASHVVVATPYEIIESQFRQGLRCGDVSVSESDWLCPRSEDLGSTEVMTGYLSEPSSRMLLTSHAQLVRTGFVALPDRLTSKDVLCLDEGHHLGEGWTQIYEFAMEWHRRGGLVWVTTATPFREDGRSLTPPGVDVPMFIVGYPELADLGLLPKRITTEIIELKDSSRHDLLKEADYLSVSQYIYTVGRFCLLRIPPGNSAMPAAKVAEAFVEALMSVGFDRDQILNTVGPSSETTNQTLAQERERLTEGFDHAKLKVVIACGRMGEGADWPACSHVVMVGVPDSVLRYIQVCGRASRGKRGIVGYPEEWVDDTLITLFVPSLGSGAERSDHIARVFMHACVLSAAEVSQVYSRYWSELVVGFRLPEVVRNRVVEVSLLGNVSSDVMLDAATLPQQLALGLASAFGRPPTVGEVVKVLRRVVGGREILYYLKSLLEGVAESDAGLDARYREVLQEVVPRVLAAAAGGAKLRPVYVDLLREALLGLVESSGDVVVDVELRIGRSFKTVLDSGRMRQIGEQMLSAVSNLRDHVSSEDLLRMVLEYKARFGVYPSRARGAQDVRALMGFPCTLSQLDQSVVASTGEPCHGLDATVAAVMLGWHAGPELSDDLVAKVAGQVTPWLRQQIEEIVEVPGRYAVAQNSPALRVEINGRRESLPGLELALRRGWRAPVGGRKIHTLLA